MTSRIRQGARGVVLDEDDNVLLVRFDRDGHDAPVLGVPPVVPEIECLPWGHDTEKVVGEGEW